jgi:hypothetical protein
MITPSSRRSFYVIPLLQMGTCKLSVRRLLPYRFYGITDILDADDNEYLSYQRKAKSIERAKRLEEQPKPLGWRKRLSNLLLWMTRARKDKTPPQVDVVGNISTPSSQHSSDEPRSE